MFGTGGSALIAKTLGEGDGRRANEIFSLLVAWGAACGVVLAVLGFVLMPSIAARLEAPAFAAPAVSIPAPSPQPSGFAAGGAEPAGPGLETVKPHVVPPTAPAAKNAETAPEKHLTVIETLRAVWLAGAAGMGLWLVWSNLAFAARLRKYRMGMEVPGCKYPVYMMESELDSPCLFGILRPAVYLTPAARRSALRIIAEGPDLELAAELCDFFAGRTAELDRAISEQCAQEEDK